MNKSEFKEKQLKEFEERFIHVGEHIKDPIKAFLAQTIDELGEEFMKDVADAYHGTDDVPEAATIMFKKIRQRWEGEINDR